VASQLIEDDIVALACVFFESSGDAEIFTEATVLATRPSRGPSKGYLGGGWC
jgi:hypothetical protein